MHPKSPGLTLIRHGPIRLRRRWPGPNFPRRTWSRSPKESARQHKLPGTASDTGLLGQTRAKPRPVSHERIGQGAYIDHLGPSFGNLIDADPGCFGWIDPTFPPILQISRAEVEQLRMGFNDLEIFRYLFGQDRDVSRAVIIEEYLRQNGQCRFRVDERPLSYMPLFTLPIFKYRRV